MLCIAVQGADISRTIHPAAPVNGLRIALAQEFQIFHGVALRIGVPNHQVCVQRICRCVLRHIHPDTDLRRRAFNRQPFCTAVANIVVRVAGLIIRCIIIVQLHRAFTKTYLTALGRRRNLQITTKIIRQRSIRPKKIRIAISSKCTRGAKVIFPSYNLTRAFARITAICIWPTFAGILCPAPVVVRAGLALAVDGLKVHERHRQLADLNVDLCAQRLVIGILHLDRGIHGLRTVAGHERVAIHVPNIRIRHTFRLGRNGPVEVAIFIDDIQTIALGSQAKVRGGTEVHRGLRAAERKRGNVRNGHGRAAGGLAVDKQLRRHLALIILRGREQAVGVDGAALAVRHGPGHIVRQLRMAAVFVHADGREPDLAVGRIDRIVRREGRVVKHAVLLRRGDQQQGAGDRALHAVGRAVADGQVAGALALRGIGRRAAAVEVDRIHNALRGQKLRLLIHRHADGVGALAAVGHKGHDRAVGLEADAVDRYERIAVMIDLAVLDQITRPGNGLQHVGAVRSGVTDGIRTVLQNSEIRLGGSAVVLLNDVALHDEVAERLRILHVVEVAVHGHDDVAAGRLGVGRCLQRCLFQVPGQILRRVLAGRGRAAFSIITAIRSFESCLRTRCDRRHKAGDLRVAFLGVQENVRFRHTVDQRIVRLADDQLVAGGLDGFIRSQCLRADQCQHHNGCQQKGPGSVCEAGRIHVSQHSLQLLSVLSKIIKKKR